MGGLGKTTLAQLLYSDEKVKAHFDLTAWVCVSDVFDILSITKALLRSIGRGARDGVTLDELQVKLESVLSGKKFFVVLDDVWNEKYQDWTILYKPFKRGSGGSKIIVTTRNQDVANLTGTTLPYALAELSDEDCLSLFAQHALGQTSFDGHPELKGTGEKLVKKCKGLPLAAKLLGGLLRNELRPDKWTDVLESWIWHLQEKNDILPVLRLSYHHLPSPLKQCFGYCAIFPKDYEFDVNELVLLWMAEGFLSHPRGEKGFLSHLKGDKHLEDIGIAYFYDLFSRSFFQQSSKGMTKFVMHDFIHDLAEAEAVAGEICSNLEGNVGRDRHPPIVKARHSSFMRQRYEVSGRFGVLDKVKGLRTLLALPIIVSDADDGNYISISVLNKLLSNLKHLRALSLSGYQIKEMPKSVSGLKHLRYLNFSKTAIRVLPDFVTSLLNLQSLLLRDCSKLEKLPMGIGYLPSLCYLDIFGTQQLKEMPVGIGNLTSLQSLARFIVGLERVDGLNIRELKNLSRLKGELSLEGLHNVENLQDARDADLKGKQNLESIVMRWKDGGLDPILDESVATNVFELLRPHRNLKRLTIQFYHGKELPTWLGDPSLMSNLVEVELCNCWSTSLPSLGRLPMLKNLIIKGMEAIKTLGYEFYGCNDGFPVLETLTFEGMLGWERWCAFGSANGTECGWKFPRLQELEILNCPILVRECLLILPSLCKLKLENCNESVLRFMLNLNSLRTLTIGEISGLSCLHESTGQLVALEDLKIYKCENLMSLLQSGDGTEANMICLRSLEVTSCPELVSFLTVETIIQRMTSLEKLIVKKCPRIGSIQIGQQQNRLKEENHDTNFMLKLRHIELDDCGDQFIDSLVNEITLSGEELVIDHLEIKSCDSQRNLTITSRRGSSNLKFMGIEDCKYLASISNNDERTERQAPEANIVEIEQLMIKDCPSLTTDGMKSVAAIKKLWVWNCCQLESVAEKSIISVEEIWIQDCPNLKKLPDKLYQLTNLTRLELESCDGLESFPEEGLPAQSLRSLTIHSCKSLKSLPKNTRSLVSLQDLVVSRCPGLESFPEGLPPGLTHLSIGDCSNMKPPMPNWGLEALTSLVSLFVGGDAVLAEPNTTVPLPTTITSLCIADMTKLKSLSSKCIQVQNLTSLTSLYLWDCPELRYLPKEGLPPMLETLRIGGCPILQNKCLEGKGKYWPIISLIPDVDIEEHSE